MSNIIPFNPPNSKKELFALLRKILKSGWHDMPITIKRYNGHGAPGNYLEDLIGLKAGNKDIADIVGWEVKFYTPRTSLITLFHKEPDFPEEPLQYMVNQYGWLDKHGRKSFRHTIKGQSDRFIAVSDAGSLIIRSLTEDGIVPMWTYDTLLNIAGGKLRRLMLVRGKRSGQKVIFEQVECFEELYLSRLIEDITKGIIAIDFDVRQDSPGSRALRNHGTKFRVSPKNIASLYKKRQTIS